MEPTQQDRAVLMRAAIIAGGAVLILAFGRVAFRNARLV